jgi:uncharacterized protein (TIGR03083 family)
METDPHRWIRALRRSQDSLDVLIATLPTERLTTQSYCTNWKISDVLSHLGSGCEIALSMLDAALEGGEPPGRDDFPAIWDRWNAKSPRDVAADAVSTNERHVAALEALEDNELDRLHVSVFGMDLDAAGLVSIRLGEHAVHTWDIAVALDPTARVVGAAVDLLVDQVGRLVSRTAKPDAAGFGRARVRIHTQGPERDLLLDVAETAGISPWSDDSGPADAVIDLPAEALVRLVYGRLDAAHTPPLTITSEHVRLDDLRRLLPGL